MFNCKWQYVNKKWKLIDSGGCETPNSCQTPNVLPQPVFEVKTACMSVIPSITLRTTKSLWKAHHEPAYDFDTGSGIVHHDEQYYWQYVSGSCGTAKYAMPNVDPKDYLDNGVETTYTKCFKEM